MSGKDNGRILGTNLGRNNFAIFDGNLGFGRIYIERELEVVPRLLSLTCPEVFHVPWAILPRM